MLFDESADGLVSAIAARQPVQFGAVRRGVGKKDYFFDFIVLDDFLE